MNDLNKLYMELISTFGEICYTDALINEKNEEFKELTDDEESKNNVTDLTLYKAHFYDFLITKSCIPIGFIILLVILISNNVPFLIGYGIFLFINLIRLKKNNSSFTYFKKYLKAREELKNITENSNNKELIDKLKLIKKEALELEEEKLYLEEKYQKIEKKFIGLLENELKKEYLKKGIDENVQINYASITPNTKNHVELVYRLEDKNKKGGNRDGRD